MPQLRRHRAPFAPPAEALARLDAARTRLQPHVGSIAPWFKRYAANQAARLAEDLANVEARWGAEARILEVGAAPYLLTEALREGGRRVTAVDLDPERFRPAIDALDLDVVACDIERDPLPLGDDTFDLVIFNEVFEHLRINPIAVVEELRRVLTPGGTLLLSTPNGLALRNLLRLVVEGRSGPSVHTEFGRLREVGHMGHVREYSARDVLDFLQALDLRPVALTRRGRYLREGAGRRARFYDLVGRALPGTRPYFTIEAVK